MKTLIMMICLLIAIPSFASNEQPQIQKPQTTCPIMGEPISKSNYTDYEGKRVYFCCSACVTEFKKDPAKYIKNMEASGIMLEKAPPATNK